MKKIKTFENFINEELNNDIVGQIKLILDNNKLTGIIIDKNENYPEKHLDTNDYVIFIGSYATGKKLSVYMKRDKYVSTHGSTHGSILDDIQTKFGGDINIISKGTVNILSNITI